MYNLAPRMGRNVESATTEHVGPNTYTTCYGRNDIRNKAPFLSCEARKPSFALPIYTEALYSYDTRNKVTGGASINYTAERKTIVPARTPGPADYVPKGDTKKCLRTPREIKGKGKVYFCRVPYTIDISPPSIPTKINENGYDIINGRLYAVPEDIYDETLGPAFYCVPMGEINENSKRYRGCKWSCSTSKRGETVHFNTPGPGAYDLEKQDLCRRNNEDEEFRALARHLSHVPRYSEKVELQSCKEDLPGPADYDVGIVKLSCNVGLNSIEERPFISGAERFKSSADDFQTPSPFHYNVSNNIHKKKQFSMTCAPFAVRDERWAKTKLDNAPGPGSYDVKGFYEENMEKLFNKYSLVKVPFGQQAERKTIDTGNAECLPGPGQYDKDKEVKQEACTASVFKSKSARFKDICSEDAGPAKYNIGEIYKKIRDRKSHHSVEVPFLTTSERMPDRDNDVPGVGQYEVPSVKPNPRHISPVSRSECSRMDETPPPGSYEIDVLERSCVAKAFTTHNIRLREQILREKLRKAPKETREKWIKDMKKSKVLRWFVEPSPLPNVRI